MQYLAMFIGGLLGSGHCIGMCGGFAVSIGSLCPKMPAGLVHQAIYSLGRIFTYGFLGAMAAWAGARLGAADGSFAAVQRAFAVTAGLLMVGLGAAQLGWLPIRRWIGGLRAAFLPRRTFARVTRVGTETGPAISYDDGAALSFFRYFLKPREPRGTFLAGVFTGLLPCGLVYAFLALAAGSGDPMAGWAGMACFGLGTMPAMVLTGCSGSILGARWRSAVQRVAAGFVILLGALTIYRGATPAGESCHVHVRTNSASLSASPCPA